MDADSSGMEGAQGPRFGAAVSDAGFLTASEFMDLDPLGDQWVENMEFTELSPSSSASLFNAPFFSLVSYSPTSTAGPILSENLDPVQNQYTFLGKGKEQQPKTVVKEESDFGFPRLISPWPGASENLRVEASTPKQGQILEMEGHQQTGTQLCHDSLRVSEYAQDSCPDPSNSAFGELNSKPCGDVASKGSDLAVADIRWNNVSAVDGSSSLKERMMRALRYIKESTGKNFLAQVWFPVRERSKWVLTTSGQPFVLDPASDKLTYFRTASLNYVFSAEEDSDESLGLPGRVFLRKLPEWTPDVQLYSKTEYPRVMHAQHYNVRGTLALPVFEPDNQTCVGVVELIMTARKFRYAPEFEKVCKALQAVNLRSSEILTRPWLQIFSEGRQNVLPEILEVLTAVCETHKLPLAQTWVPCRHRSLVTERNSKGSCLGTGEDPSGPLCMSTVVEACYMTDSGMTLFQEACSEQHLLRGQGVPGIALASNEPYFQSDITTFSKTQYPLVHYARMFNLSGAVAIRLRSVYSGTDDYVLEFFLPVECRDYREQQEMLKGLSGTMQQVCRSLRVVSSKELAEEGLGQMKTGHHRGDGANISNDSLDMNVTRSMDQSEFQEWKQDSLLLSQSVDIKTPKVDSPPNFQGQHLCYGSQGTADQKQIPQTDMSELAVTSLAEKSFSLSGNTNTRRGLEKRRGKLEKNISLAVLQQHFAGSLKDAAKSIGVCPTTLKRICRQHGILRWPSRKISKVNRSLKKLQGVIESVQGVEGAFKIGAFATGSFSHITNLWTPEIKLETIPDPNKISAFGREDHVCDKSSMKYSSLPTFTVSQSLPASGTPITLPSIMSYKESDHGHAQAGVLTSQACAVSVDGVTINLEGGHSSKLLSANNLISSSRGNESPCRDGNPKSSECSQTSSSSHPSSHDAEANDPVSSSNVGLQLAKEYEQNYSRQEHVSSPAMKWPESEKLLNDRNIGQPTRSSSFKQLDKSPSQCDNSGSHGKSIHEDSQTSSPNPSSTASAIIKSEIISEKVPSGGKLQTGRALLDESMVITVKATYKEDTVRFKLSAVMGFQELSEEIARRFQLDSGTMNLRYLDDDSEWVLLTCDADMYECIDILKSSGGRTIKLLVQDVHHNIGSSCGSNAGL